MPALDLNGGISIGPFDFNLEYNRLIYKVPSGQNGQNKTILSAFSSQIDFSFEPYENPLTLSLAYSQSFGFDQIPEGTMININPIPSVSTDPPNTAEYMIQIGLDWQVTSAIDVGIENDYINQYIAYDETKAYNLTTLMFHAVF